LLLFLVPSRCVQILLWGGCVFFAACILYQHLYGVAAATAGAAAGGVVGGLLLQVRQGWEAAGREGGMSQRGKA
jgi:hypothetical protein